jgi:hypothetical protein
MDPHVEASLLWGMVALLAFLVLVQGYELLAAERVTVGVKAVVAVLVGTLGVVTSHLAQTRLRARSGSER